MGLISTLISLTLVVRLAMVLQSVSLNNTRVMKRLIQQHEDDLALDAAYEMARPYVAMVFSTREPVLKTLDWEGHQVEAEMKSRQVWNRAAVLVRASSMGNR